MSKTKKLICGWGINDADYKVRKCEKIDDKFVTVWECPLYAKWRSMIERCHLQYLQNIYPTYRGCVVTEEWKYFSNFRKWVLEEQPNKDWMNCELDKDLLGGSTIYSPTTCVFVTKQINTFLLNNASRRGDYLIGVSRYGLKFKAECRNPFTKKGEYLGLFTTELEAHKAWQAKKHEYACQLADLQDDPRVAKALREQYAPDKDLTNK